MLYKSMIMLLGYLYTLFCISDVLKAGFDDFEAKQPMLELWMSGRRSEWCLEAKRELNGHKGLKSIRRSRKISFYFWIQALCPVCPTSSVQTYMSSPTRQTKCLLSERFAEPCDCTMQPEFHHRMSLADCSHFLWPFGILKGQLRTWEHI